MTPDERNLLLTAARILRARVREDQDDPSGNNRADFLALDEALKPFDPVVNFHSTNEEREEV